MWHPYVCSRRLLHTLHLNFGVHDIKTWWVYMPSLGVRISISPLNFLETVCFATGIKVFFMFALAGFLVLHVYIWSPLTKTWQCTYKVQIIWLATCEWYYPVDATSSVQMSGYHRKVCPVCSPFASI